MPNHTGSSELYFLPCDPDVARTLVIPEPKLIIPLHLEQTSVVIDERCKHMDTPGSDGYISSVITGRETQIDVSLTATQGSDYRKLRTRCGALQDMLGKTGILVLLYGAQPTALTFAVRPFSLDTRQDSFNVLRLDLQLFGLGPGLQGSYTVKRQWATARYDCGDGTYIQKPLYQEIPLDDWLTLRYNKW